MINSLGRLAQLRPRCSGFINMCVAELILPQMLMEDMEIIYAISACPMITVGAGKLRDEGKVSRQNFSPRDKIFEIAQGIWNF